MRKLRLRSNSAAAQAKAEAAWRRYYDSLSDDGKRKVWQDYYDRTKANKTADKVPNRPPARPQHKPSRFGSVVVSLPREKRVGFFSMKNQLRSIVVGLVCGAIVVAAFLFVLFNEMVIAPFVRPGQGTVQAAVDKNGTLIDRSPKVRIPKIKVEIPVVYGLGTTDDDQFELALDKGVVHYPTTALPGQAGNAAFFGHSSNNIFNPGKYKFAFVLLHELVPGDTFSLTYDGKLYSYEVVSKRVVKPSQVSVLGPVAGYAATATLITCDPPGTSNNRLVVVGKQVSPSPDGSAPLPSTELPEAPSIENLPGNGPGLLNRLWRSIFGEQ